MSDSADNQPYYSEHVVTRLTCPFCKAMLNRKFTNGKFNCECGQWHLNVSTREYTHIPQESVDKYYKENANQPEGPLKRKYER